MQATSARRFLLVTRPDKGATVEDHRASQGTAHRRRRRTRPFGRRPGAGRPPIGVNVSGDPLAAAATYLGISESDLHTKLRAGQTLAAIAVATSGKNRDGLIRYVVNDAKAKITAAQQAGTLTADQATRLTSGLQDRITRLVDSTGARFGPGGFRRGR